MENYEQKYKEALNVMEGLYNVVKYQSSSDALLTSQTIEKAFPELKESEDEKIRKEIIQSIQDNMSVIHKDKCIAWLEKQGEQKTEIKYVYPKFRIGDVIEPIKPNGFYRPVRVLSIGGKTASYYCESDDKKSFLSFPIICENEYKLVEQKPADKVEPKFKVGDWVRAISSGNIFKILSVNDGLYRVLCYDGVEANYPIEVEKDLVYWTIQDAKDGDVLVTKIDEEPNDFIYIFNEYDQKLGFWSHCYLDAYINRFHEGIYHNNYNVGVPATKEHRELLFQKMKEAGYEWDSDKKELKKIEQKPKEKTKFYDSMDDLTADTLIKEIEGSELDDREKHNFIYWIKSHMQNHSWSEEDERMIDNIIFELEENEEHISGVTYKINWLKSIKPNHWKPSEEQMQALFEAKLASIKNREYFLGLLYEDLKKL